MTTEDAPPPGETGATLTLPEVMCLVVALQEFEAAHWSRMPRAGSAAYHARAPMLGMAYVLRGRLERRAVELAREAVPHG